MGGKDPQHMLGSIESFLLTMIHIHKTNRRVESFSFIHSFIILFFHSFKILFELRERDKVLGRVTSNYL